MTPGSTLEALYAEVCNAYHAITEFRGKLLALVPVVSGAGFTLIIGSPGDVDQRLLLPLGIFGLAVTGGPVRLRAAWDLPLPRASRPRRTARAGDAAPPAAGDPIPGHFLDRPKSHRLRDACRLLDRRRLIMVPTASFLVYGSVILGWLVVSGFGVAEFV
jgi:hypothetical protein